MDAPQPELRSRLESVLNVALRRERALARLGWAGVMYASGGDFACGLAADLFEHLARIFVSFP